MIGRSRLVVVCAWLAACGGSAPPPRAPERAPAPAAPPPAPPAISNAPPAALAAYWVPDSGVSTFSARLALGKLARGPLFQAMLPTLRPSLPEGYGPCLDALVQHADELLVRGAADHRYAVMSFAGDGLAAVRSACVGPVVPRGTPLTLEGASEAFTDGQEVLALVPPSTALFGKRAEVEAALAPGRAAAPLPAHFTLKSDELLTVVVDVPAPPVTVAASLTSRPELFSLEARAGFAGEELAEGVERGFNSFRAQAKERVKEAGGDRAVQELLDGITLERQGPKLHATLSLRGSVEQQAHAIGQLVAISVVATERYLVNAKTAEAKLVLASIVRSYQQSLRDAQAASPKKPRRLASLPAVPARVPRGDLYQSTPEDWKAWDPIHFALTEPQRFQYEVVAAKDGKSAQVIARGDLDGDGDLSERRLTIELDPKTSQLTAKGLEETKPLE